MKTILLSLLLCASAFAQCPTPTPPPNVSVNPASPYNALFVVNPRTPPTAGYAAERRMIFPVLEPWEVINTGYPSGLFNDLYELLPGATYEWRTRAYTLCHDHTFSVYTQVVTATMPNGPAPNEGAPDPPTNLTAAYVNGAVQLNWTPGAFPVVPGQFQVFEVQRSGDGIAYGSINFTRDTHFADHPLPGHAYYYRLRSYNGFGWATEMYFECRPNETDCGTAFSNPATVTIP